MGILSKLLKREPKVKTIVAHGDADGAAAAAIALRRYPKAKLVLAGPRSAERAVERAEKPCLVLDIKVQPREGVEVIDHHPSRSKSTTELMAGWPEATGYLVMLGVAGDRPRDVAELSIVADARLLNMALRLATREEAEAIIRELAKGRRASEIEAVRRRAREFDEEFLRLRREALRRLEDWGEVAVALYPEVNPRFVAAIASSLSTDLGKDFAIVWRRRERGRELTLVTLRSRNALGVFERMASLDPGHEGHGGHREAGTYKTLLPLEHARLLVLSAYGKADFARALADAARERVEVGEDVRSAVSSCLLALRARGRAVLVGAGGNIARAVDAAEVAKRHGAEVAGVRVYTLPGREAGEGNSAIEIELRPRPDFSGGAERGRYPSKGAERPPCQELLCRGAYLESQ